MKLDAKIVLVVFAVFHTHIKKNEANMVNITQTTNEILFYPKGKIVPELSWGTIRIKLNISTIWKDTKHLCKSYNLAKKETARIFHINNLTRATPQMSISIIKDLKHYCHLNSKIID